VSRLGEPAGDLRLVIAGGVRLIVSGRLELELNKGSQLATYTHQQNEFVPQNKGTSVYLHVYMYECVSHQHASDRRGSGLAASARHACHAPHLLGTEDGRQRVPELSFA